MPDGTAVTNFPVIRDPLLAEVSGEGKNGLTVPKPFDATRHGDIPAGAALPALPELSEVETVRHFTRLSRLNFGIDTGMYPLGSCTMKHNPKICEEIASRIACVHPADRAGIAPVLEWLLGFKGFLEEICGMEDSCLWPAAGAHGELTGMLVIREALKKRGQDRSKVLIPDTAHGTNPASCAIAGFTSVNVPSGPDGYLKARDLAGHLDGDVAALMITNPNTLGIFEQEILEIAGLLHENGSYLYMDGANLNALMGIARPGDMGVDCMHINLHKTFGAPHGGGGPGSGPVLVKRDLAPFLPVPRIDRDTSGSPVLDSAFPDSIGMVHSRLGNVAVLLKAYVYCLCLGPAGLRDVSLRACLNANYLKARLKKTYDLPYETATLHEFVLSDRAFKPAGVTTIDIAKALMDHGFHPPTVYFPLVVPGAIMVEPTETEPRSELDRFVEAMEAIAARAGQSPENLRQTPGNVPVERIDEVWAARNLVLTWMDMNPSEEDRYLNG
ncbi:MAG TPA: aminomethyl-transferring glycine dehydrogenase subunit GcvPB [Deltaproteobacteria bacterium]|jgi:glycine dehydrogenase subunit 2|nr:aminomethyl-transferring glycine dehydrogenase subunit GcvPB [Deltaproteobacteria bacterium]HRW80832.1 aminomethyl-transferring glycine dehydrogenase subunit GcvPB [Desulfomonilia bacterium]HNQ86176.1 aminomethyl-transferring glycine dehydrogenase subunit GcvPB [Deltaproteobacteria bacterium]HNS89019.1 aminomethyl-transferring glycine dehydrogenase subunit GcvPB [Deltaproteobacteria bacterium]HOA43767.1 aminomethyl-transferring glycine dehydrogenase subunit GcvPB [Deltaproteobacteria bacteri